MLLLDDVINYFSNNKRCVDAVQYCLLLEVAQKECRRQITPPHACKGSEGQWIYSSYHSQPGTRRRQVMSTALRPLQALDRPGVHCQKSILLHYSLCNVPYSLQMAEHCPQPHHCSSSFRFVLIMGSKLLWSTTVQVQSTPVTRACGATWWPLRSLLQQVMRNCVYNHIDGRERQTCVHDD